MPTFSEKYGSKQKQPSKFNLENIFSTVKDIYKYYQVGAPLAALSALNLPQAIAGKIQKYNIEKAQTPQELVGQYTGIGYDYSKLPTDIKNKALLALEAVKEVPQGKMTGYGEFFKSAMQKGGVPEKVSKYAAPALGFVFDVAQDPSMWFTFGGASALKFGEYGATRAGAKYFANLMKISRAGGMGEEAAYAGARETMETILEIGGKNASKYFTKGGIRLAEFIPEWGGETIVPWEKLKPVLEPLAKYTGAGKLYTKFKASEFKKFIDAALRPRAGVPEQLYEFGRTAMARNQYDIGLKVTDLGNSLRKLGGFVQSEKEDVFYAIAKPGFFEQAPKKIQEAGKLIDELQRWGRQSLVDRGVPVGWWDNYMQQIYKGWGGKKWKDLQRFAEITPGAAEETTVTIAGITRPKEIFEYSRTLFKNFIDAEAAGLKVEKDAFKLVEHYVGQVTRVHSYMDLVDKAKEFGIALDIAGGIPEGFVRGKGILSDYAFPTDVAEYLGRYSETFFNDEAMNYIVRKMINPFLRWFRTVATVLRPGFHTRNIGSDMFNGFMNKNYDPLNYANSLKAIFGDIFSKSKIGKLKTLGNKWLDETVTTTAGEKIALRKFLYEGNRRNALGFGWIGLETIGGKGLSTDPTWLNVLKGINPLGAESYLARMGRAAGLTGENFSRLSDFINVTRRTGSFDEAGRLAKKFHFDYSEQTPFTQNIARKIYPFFTWLWKNTALQFEQILKQPAKYGLIGKVKENIEQLSEDIDETNLQSYVKEEAGIRLPMKDKKGNWVYLRPDLPYQSIFDITDIGELISGVSPQLKIPYELAAGKEIFSGRKIMPYKDYRAEAPSYLAKLPEPLRKFLGITIEKEKGKEIARMNPYLEYLFRQVPPLATLGRTTLARDLSSEYAQKMWMYRVLSFLTGLGLTPYNPEEAVKKAGATTTTKSFSEKYGSK